MDEDQFEHSKSFFPMQLDDNVIRAVASITFMTAILMQVEPILRFLILPLFTDFVLRYIHPKFSPLARFNKLVCRKVVKKTPKMVWAPPKRFAILIGMIMTGLMTISFLLQFSIMFQVLLIFLIIASGLQAWYDYCLGCQMYDWLVKLGIVGKTQTISSFSTYLQSMKGESEPNHNLKSTERISASINAEAMADGKLSKEESELINSITNDLNRYEKMLSNALSDGVITKEERRKLWRERKVISQKAVNIAESDGVITSDEETLLLKLQEIIKVETISH